jgi:hypothetical protein
MRFSEGKEFAYIIQTAMNAGLVLGYAQQQIFIFLNCTIISVTMKVKSLHVQT